MLAMRNRRPDYLVLDLIVRVGFHATECLENEAVCSHANT